MSKNTLIAALVVFSILNSILIYSHFNESAPNGKLQDRKQKLSPVIQSKDKLAPVSSSVLEVNRRNAAINNFSCENLEVKVWQDGNRFKLTGKLYFEKTNKFRLEINSVFGKELDIGSNDTVFWYWSKRDKQPGLHFAKYEDFQKTRLKAPFSPMFMRSSLGLEVIEPEKAIKIAENDKDVMLTYIGANGSGLPINRSIFVNKIAQRIDAFLLTGENGKSIASCEIQEYANDLPVRLLYTWHEENKILGIKFTGSRTNTKIDPSKWIMPNYTPKLDMADQF